MMNPDMLSPDPFEEPGDEDADVAPGPAHLNVAEGLWKCQDGTVVRIRGGMSDKHLRNAIQWMKERALWDHPKYEELLAERKYRSRR